MKKLLASDQHPMSRRRIIRHAFASGSLLVTGILVVGFAQMGGQAASSTTYSDGCSPRTQTFTVVGYHPRTATKTIYKTRTVYRTRTKTICRTTTVNGTETTTITVTVTEPGTTETVTSTTTETGTTTETATKTVTVTETFN